MKQIVIIMMSILMLASTSYGAVELDGDDNGAVDISKGGTNSVTADGARVNIGIPDGTTEGDLLSWDDTAKAWVRIQTISGVGLLLNSDETNLMWDGTDSYNVHLDGIFEPLDATILKDADIGVTVASENADINVFTLVYSDLTSTETGDLLPVVTSSSWQTAEIKCTGTEEAVIWTLWAYDSVSDITATELTSATSELTITTGTYAGPIDISGFTSQAAGSYIRLDIDTVGGASKCTVTLKLVNN